MKHFFYFTLVCILMSPLYSNSQIVYSNSNVIATYGLGQDDSKILEYLKNKKWVQKTITKGIDKEHVEIIEMEFLGFEKESNSKPFSFGKKSNSENTDPVRNMVFTKNLDNLRETFYFNSNGSLSVTYLNTSPISGTYNFIESEKKLYVNYGNRQRVFTIENRGGKNLSISGESVYDIRLYETNGNSEFIKIGNDSSIDDQYKSIDYSYLLPENRFLFQYTVYRERLVTENGRPILKDVKDIKYGYIYKISVIRREDGTGIRDSEGILLRNPNIPWAEAILELVVGVGNGPFKPSMSTSQMIEKGVVRCSINICNDCKSTDKKFSYKDGLDKLFINTCLHDAGWNYNETIGKNYEYYLMGTQSKSLSPCVSGNCNDGFGTYIYNNDDKYTGNWLNNIPNGNGTYYFKNGDKYEGEILNGKIHGKGVFTFQDGDTYVGEFVNAKKHGNGTLTIKGNKYIGEFIDDRLKHGTYIDKNGDKYVGELLSGKPHGYGIYTFKDGKINKGLFENGNFIGEK